jgi:RHS repeat-associated protein
LGSAQVITDYQGELYERIEYTPYGETWIEHKYPGYNNTEIPYRFTSKELDLETGFYYYGARYLDPKTSRWISGDPALGDYLPSAPVDEEAKKRNGSLPGQGGVFNLVNLHVYHYAGNNPVKYTDPDGRDVNSSIVIPDPLAQKVVLRDQRELEKNGSGRCQYNTLIGATEERVGKNMTRTQKDELFTQLSSGDNPSVESSGFVNRPNDIVNSALEKMGVDSEFTAEVSRERPTNIDMLKPEDVFTIRVFNKGGHFNLGDSKGRFIWESLEYNNSANVKKGSTNDLRYIIFTRKDN